MNKMKIIYVKFRDPVAWFKPAERWHEEDLEFFDNATIRVAGILLNEDDNKVVIGEITLAKDNKKSEEWGVKYPSYRYVMIIAKSSIVDRQDFEIKEK